MFLAKKGNVLKTKSHFHSSMKFPFHHNAHQLSYPPEQSFVNPKPYDQNNKNKNKTKMFRKGLCHVDMERGKVVCRFRENGIRCKICPLFEHDIIYYIGPTNPIKPMFVLGKETECAY